ncbi:MAG: hypothetical protein K6G87_17105 [Butyrivibrio sp.]|uniref:hypothetical protein n=1 Tax=Butyrivibrio sp. TaxID=28121 RepID=UPI0025F90994|nr:hypothetical protein [Butyrivibrio sp.]MCR5772944.1 hypothetical protein [Butyrivibrio sp.]
MKKIFVGIGILAVIIIVMILSFFLKYGKREVVTQYNPSDSSFYVKVYQTGFLRDYRYKCVCILYGPDGEISREYFYAMSTDGGVKTHMDYSIEVQWKDEFVSISVKDPKSGGVTRKFYIDGRITLEECGWDADF